MTQKVYDFQQGITPGEREINRLEKQANAIQAKCDALDAERDALVAELEALDELISQQSERLVGALKAVVVAIDKEILHERRKSVLPLRPSSV